MTRAFQRGLSEQLLADLLGGPCSTVLTACVEAGLDVRLRANYVSLYYRGRSMARIVGRRGRPAKLEIHHKYVEGLIRPFSGRTSGGYLAFDVDADFAEAYPNKLVSMIRLAHKHAGPEEDVELGLLRHNDESADVCCFDRQIQVPGTRRTLDVVGLTSASAPALVAIEVKRYPDNRIQDVPGQLHEYLEILDPDRKGLREDVADSYGTVCGQLRRLGLAAPSPERIKAGMPVEGLVVVSGYNRNSQLLPRAHDLAAKLERSMYLWEAGAGEFVVPPPKRWQVMGRSGYRLDGSLEPSRDGDGLRRGVSSLRRNTGQAQSPQEHGRLDGCGGLWRSPE